MGRDARRAKQARRDQRRRTGGRAAPFDPSEPVILRADVRQDVIDDDGTVTPWSVTVVLADAIDDARTTTADTLPDLFALVVDLQENLSDQLDRPVGTLWSLDGDPGAWHVVAALHGLDQHQTDQTITLHT